MGIVINLLTGILILDLLIMGFLILLQLPKKEAGMGTAFGGGATDALFGAGTGDVLTKATGYAAGIFLILSLVLSVMGSRQASASRDSFKRALESKAAAAPAIQLQKPPAVAPAVTSTNTSVAMPAATNAVKPTTAPAEPLKLTVPAAATNAAPAKKMS